MSPHPVPDGFSGTDSPANAGGLDGEHKERPEPEAGPHVQHAKDGAVAGQTPSRERGLWPPSFLLTNIRGLVGGRGRNKSPFLHDLAVQRNCLWVAITESWLRPDILDSELLAHLPGYSVMRQDRRDRIRGGVCLLLRDDLTGEIVSCASNGVCELLIVHVHQVNTLVTVVYRPPDTKLSEFVPIIKQIDEVFKTSHLLVLTSHY